MRAGHVNAQHGRAWPCPRDSCQDTCPGIVWRPCSNWSEGAGRGRVDRPCTQAHVSIAHYHALALEPERHRALLAHPEGMVLWTRPPADLGIPLHELRIVGTPLHDRDVRDREGIG